MKKGEADLDSVDDFFDSDTCEISCDLPLWSQRKDSIDDSHPTDTYLDRVPILPPARLTDRPEDSDISGVFEEEPTPQPHAHMSPADHSPGLERTFMGGDADTDSDGITPVASPAPAAIAIANDSDDDDVLPGETLRSSPKRLASPMKNASPKSRTKVRCAQSCAGTRPARLVRKVVAHHHNARPTSMHQAAVITRASPLKNIASSTPMQSTPVKHLSFTPEVRVIMASFSQLRLLSPLLPPSTPHATLTLYIH